MCLSLSHIYNLSTVGSYSYSLSDSDAFGISEKQVYCFLFSNSVDDLIVTYSHSKSSSPTTIEPKSIGMMIIGTEVTFQKSTPGRQINVTVHVLSPGYCQEHAYSSVFNYSMTIHAHGWDKTRQVCFFPHYSGNGTAYYKIFNSTNTDSVMFGITNDHPYSLNSIPQDSTVETSLNSLSYVMHYTAYNCYNNIEIKFVYTNESKKEIPNGLYLLPFYDRSITPKRTLEGYYFDKTEFVGNLKQTKLSLVAKIAFTLIGIGVVCAVAIFAFLHFKNKDSGFSAFDSTAPLI